MKVVKPHFSLQRPGRSGRLLLTGAALWSAALWVLAPASQAQNSNNNPDLSVAQGAPRDTVKNYKLGPEDVLNVVVQGYPDYSVDQLVVPPDGKIVMPILGQFNVTGKTAAQVQHEMRVRLGKRMRDSSRLTVGIVKLRSAGIGNVYIIGKVRAPGTVTIKAGWRLTEVITSVGGVTGRPDEMSATLARFGKPPVKLNLYAAISHPGDSRVNVAMQPGDFLSIEEEELGTISVSGDVAKPGLYEVRRAPTANTYELPMQPHLLDAIVAAGGIPNSNRSAKDNVSEGRMSGYIMRGRQRIELRLEDAVTYRDDSANILLQPGDFLTVTVEKPLSIYVDGYVKSPGNIAVNVGGGVVEAIAQAGGVTTGIDRIKSTVLRDGNVIPVDLEAAVLRGDASANLKLETGDVVQLNEIKVIRVQVTGDVQNPTSEKPLHLPLDTRLMEALTQAGGLRLKPNQARITILRDMPDGTQRPLTIDPVALFERNDLSQNARLQDGDIISVSQVKTQTVTISGQVNRPGPFELKETDSLAALITQAGGPSERALLTRVIVQRDGKNQEVDAYDAVKSGKPLNFDLQDGDFIVVPENKNEVMVLEAVNRPGVYPIPEREGLTVLEALNAAGGPLPGAKTKEVALLRPTANGQTTTTIIPINDLSKNPEARQAANIPLQPGDYLVVPPAKATKSFLSRAIQAASTFSLFRAFLP